MSKDRPQLKRGETITLDITGYAFGGKGFAKWSTDKETAIVFVPGTYPGQRVEARIVKKRKKYTEARLMTVVSDAPDALDVPYQLISGAPYIRLPVARQRELKMNATLEMYRRVGKLPHIDAIFDAYLPSPMAYHYRNKMEYAFSSIRQLVATAEEEDNAFALGFKARGTWWKVENLDRPSGLFDAEWETALKTVRQFLAATGLPAWHPPRKNGFFRHLIVRKSFDQDQLLLHLVTSSQGVDQFDRQSFSHFVQRLLGKRLAGLQHTVNDDVADRLKIENGNTQLLFGLPVVLERLAGLQFEVSMESFFQTNPKSAEQLYEKAIDYAMMAPPPPGSVVMDLFCGTGTIGQLMAAKQKSLRVVGVDNVSKAIEDARRNARRNNLSTIDFFASDVGRFLVDFPQYKGKVHTVMIDPPRAGIAPKTLKKIMALGARQLIYISCNPATQARDAQELSQSGYLLKKIALVDQFPHTAHVEAVARFEHIAE